MATLEQLREKIEKIDRTIIKKLAARQKLSVQIGTLKAKMGKPVLDLAREKKLQRFYDKLSLQHQLDANWIQKIFKLIVAHSRKCQKPDLLKKNSLGNKK